MNEMSQVNEYFVSDSILDQIEDTVIESHPWHKEWNEGGMDRTYVTYTDQLYQQENGIFLGDGVVRPKRHTRLKNVVDVLDFDNFKE
jgi:hypothetical protein